MFRAQGQLRSTGDVEVGSMTLWRKLQLAIWACLIGWLFLGASALAAPPPQRFAIVIGNSAYSAISPLPNAVNDAELMASTLADLGFEVVSAFDADRLELGRAIQQFGSTLRDADKDAVALFYYAGHGVQSQGTNYIIPIGANILAESDLDLEALSTDSILRQMRDANVSTNIVVLDACRNNPFANGTRSADRGLARVSTNGGALIAFAAAPGQVAADGDGANSPYTAALTRAMQLPGLTIEQVFKQVLVEVEAETGGKQIPWVQSSLRSDFYFSPAAQTDGAGASRAEKEITYWTAIRDIGGRAELSAFLDAFPAGVFAGAARARLAALEADEAAAVSDETAEVASIDPVVPPPEPALSAKELAKAVQDELNRVGCDAGTADGIWGRRSRDALAAFGDNARLDLASLEPSLELLDRLTDAESRVCPLKLFGARGGKERRLRLQDLPVRPEAQFQGRLLHACSSHTNAADKTDDNQIERQLHPVDRRDPV